MISYFWRKREEVSVALPSHHDEDHSKLLDELTQVIRRCIVIREEDAPELERRDAIRRYLLTIDMFLFAHNRHNVIERWVRVFVP